MPVLERGTHGSQMGSQGLHVTASHGEQAAGSHGSHWEASQCEADVVYTTWVASLVREVGKIDPVRHQLLDDPLEEQPVLTKDSNNATEQNNANFLMV